MNHRFSLLTGKKGKALELMNSRHIRGLQEMVRQRSMASVRSSKIHYQAHQLLDNLPNLQTLSPASMQFLITGHTHATTKSIACQLLGSLFCARESDFLILCSNCSIHCWNIIGTSQTPTQKRFAKRLL